MVKISKKIITVIACGIMGLAISAGQSLAAVDCDSASLSEVRAVAWDITRSSSYMIEATCMDTSPAWSGARTFYISSGNQEDSMYATALTAMSLNNRVALKLVNANANSLVTQIDLTSTSN